MRYTIAYACRFTYEALVEERAIEARLQPRTEGRQRCLAFELAVSPAAPVTLARDDLGNAVHRFEVAQPHLQLAITARADVEVSGASPALALPPQGWEAVDAWEASGEYWDFQQPGGHTRWTPALRAWAERHARRGREDPLTAALRLAEAVHDQFEYDPTRVGVETDVDQLLRTGRGGHADLAHLLVAATRWTGLPARYVSGFRAARQDAADGALAAMHAWMEALLPEMGWVGFDPAAGITTGDGHIAVAVGREGFDVLPIRSSSSSAVRSTVDVSLEIAPHEAAPAMDLLLPDAS